MFLTIWKYKIIPGEEIEFEKLYSPVGKWVKLFQKYPDYIKIELLKDVSVPEYYLTIDYWKSKEAFYKFKLLEAEKFNKIDKMGEKVTLKEIHLGEYQIHF